MTKIIQKTLETVVHATGVSTLFRGTWNEYKAAQKAIKRSKRLGREFDERQKKG